MVWSKGRVLTMKSSTIYYAPTLQNSFRSPCPPPNRLGKKSEKNHVRESGMLEAVNCARYLYWPLPATPSLDGTWFEALSANYGRFSKWPPNILQMYIRWDLYVLETWSWCLNICFWGQGIHWTYLFEDIIDHKFNKAHMMQKYCRFIPCIHVSLQCRSLFGFISCLYFPLNVYCKICC